MSDLRTGIATLLGRYESTRRMAEWWKHTRTSGYLLSYPKCGRTWLRLMVGKALDEHFALGVANPMEIGLMYRKNPAIPRLRVTHEQSHLEVISRSKQQFRHKNVVFLVRDPRDVVVSMYFEASRRSDQFAGDISTFLRAPIGSLDSIIDYYNAWAASRHVPARFLTVRYEELHQDPAGTVARVLDTFGVVVSAAAIATAVEYSKFDNMRKLERANAFGSVRLRPGNSADPESFKTRKGKVGGYREYVAGDDLAFVERRLAERLAPYWAAYRQSPG